MKKKKPYKYQFAMLYLLTKRRYLASENNPKMIANCLNERFWDISV